MLRVQLQQFVLLCQLEVLETEGRADGASDEAETAFGRDLGGKPLLRLDDHLHFVLLGKLMGSQGSVWVDYIDVERIARVKIPDFHHIVQTMERRYVVSGQHVIDGGDWLFARFVVAIQLAVITPFRMRNEAQFLDVFRRVHTYFKLRFSPAFTYPHLQSQLCVCGKGLSPP